MDSESDDGEFGTLRLCGQFQVVHADQHHPVFEQSGSVQGEAGKITPSQLLSRLLRGKRRQQSCQIPPLAI